MVTKINSTCIGHNPDCLFLQQKNRHVPLSQSEANVLNAQRHISMRSLADGKNIGLDLSDDVHCTIVASIAKLACAESAGEQ